MPLRMICDDEALFNNPAELKNGESYRIGRSSSCSFVVKDLSVSRFHAEVTPSERAVVVKDLGSRNGTYVDGLRVAEAEVHPGQSVRFGNAVFYVMTEDLQTPAVGGNSEISTFLMPAPDVSQGLSQLSEAQRRVLDILLEGRSEKEVATQLEISPHTVHNHVKEIYKRMNVNSRPELLALFVRDSRKKPRKSR